MDFYDIARKHALFSPESLVGGMPTGRRLKVYGLRTVIEPGLLREASPQDLLRAGFAQGVVGDKGIVDLELGEVVVTGDRA
jgi:hypothetical protein